jgi:hypothetical protein
VERGHEETSSFHLPFGEMTVILDEAVEWMETYLGSDLGDALIEVEKTKGAHCQFGYLQRIFKESLKEQFALEIEHGGVTEEVQRLWDQAVCIYLLYLVGITFFTTRARMLWMLST